MLTLTETMKLEKIISRFTKRKEGVSSLFSQDRYHIKIGLMKFYCSFDSFSVLNIINHSSAISSNIKNNKTVISLK